MTPTGWLAMAAAVLLCSAPGRAPSRLRDLAARHRLAELDRGRPRLRRPRPSGLLVVLGGAAVGAVGWRTGPALGIAAAAVLAVGAVLVRDARANRAGIARRADLRAAVRVLVSELEAGALAAAALSAAAEVASQYANVLRDAASEAAAGGDAATVLIRDPDTRAIGLAWALGQDTGAPLADVLGRVADDLAATDDQRRAVMVALSGPRSSAVVLTGLPVVGIALGVAMGAQPLAFLGGSSAGRLVCCVGVLFDAAGVLWMRRIVRSAQQP